MDEDLLIPIIVPLIVFASLVLVIATPFYFRHRNRRVLYEAIKTSVEETGQADPKLIAAITQENIGPNADLRRGILMIALAGGLAILGKLTHSNGIILGTAAIPGLIGIAYVMFHFFIPREPTV